LGFATVVIAGCAAEPAAGRGAAAFAAPGRRIPVEPAATTPGMVRVPAGDFAAGVRAEVVVARVAGAGLAVAGAFTVGAGAGAGAGAWAAVIGVRAVATGVRAVVFGAVGVAGTLTRVAGDFAASVRVAGAFGASIRVVAIAPASSVEAVTWVELEPPAFAARNDQPGFAPAAAAKDCFAGFVVAGVGRDAGVAGAAFGAVVAGGTTEAFGPEPAIGLAALVRSMRSALVNGAGRAPVVVAGRVVRPAVVAGRVARPVAEAVGAAWAAVRGAGVVVVVGAGLGPGFAWRFASTVMP
jgi:hypothetical protein